jgi:MATE family multidrug resistance protein
MKYQQPKNVTQLKAWWRAPSGYREVLTLAGPLVLSTGANTIQQFINRVFLSWYSDTAFEASLPAGITSFTILCFFIGTASYANTFVAQYYGSGQHSRVSTSVWQAIYFSILASVLILAFIPLAAPIFNWAGHDPSVRKLEIQYFTILAWGGGFAVLSSALSCFFTGMGKTWTVLMVSFAATIINIALDYLLIFGHAGLPEMGIRGAAIATVVSSIFGAIAYFIIFLSGKNNALYGTRRERHFDPSLFSRLMRFGAPSGVQFMLDLVAFSLFILLVGRLGRAELGATNLAIQVNTVAFLPMIGFSIATATLVGQRLGENKPVLAARATWSAFHMTFIYMTLMAVLYVTVPRLFLLPFAMGANPKEFAPIYSMAIVILRFVALYSIFDTMNLIFASALKGAGDTVFVMFLSTSLGLTLMVIPTWLVCTYGGGIYTAWAFLTLFVTVLGFSFLARFLHGRWRHMRVIETPPIDADPLL